MGCLDVVIRSLRHAMDVVAVAAERARVSLSRLGGAVVRIERLKGAEATYERITADVRVNVGLICSVGVGRYEYLACSDLGYIRTLDKGFIIVPKR